MNPLVELRGRLSRHEIRSKIDEVDKLIERFKINSRPADVPPGYRQRWRSMKYRLDDETRAQLAEDRQAGMKLQALAEKYFISLSSVKRLLKELGSDSRPE
jgi:hypothetical protein